MVDPAEVEALYRELKPGAINAATQYVLARTPSDMQQQMQELIEADWPDPNSGDIPDAPADGKLYARQNNQWVEINVGEPVVVSAGAVSGTPILLTPTPFAVNPPSPNLGNYWDQASQEFAPPPGAYQINAALACVSTNNAADATLMMMLNGVEFAQVTAGAAMGNIMSCTLGVAIVTNPGDVIAFKMLADRADMTVRTPGSGLSIIGRSFAGT